MLWFIVLLLLAGGGFYFFQKLKTIEREIRAEQETEKASTVAAPSVAPVKAEAKPKQEAASDPPIVTSEVANMTAKAAPVSDGGMSTEDEIVAAVTNLPGVKQTELYGSFPDVDKKKLQQLIKELTDSGRLKREKQGSSYALYPI